MQLNCKDLWNGGNIVIDEGHKVFVIDCKDLWKLI